VLASALEATPTDPDALELLAAVKHRRGELTLAIGCWRTTDRLRSAPRPSVHQALLELRRAAISPGTTHAGAAKIHAMRDLDLAEKLVEAYRWLERISLESARALRHEVATTTRDGADELHRLAHFVEASLCDMVGDIVAACTVLESLGRTRSYANDPERLLALAGRYERTGERERATAALRIYDRLDSLGHDDGTLEARRTRAHESLGADEPSRRHERRHLAEVTRRAHRPSARKLVETSARLHLPLSRLTALYRDAVAVEDLPRAVESKRTAALVAAFTGDVVRAERELPTDGTSLERCLRAELAALQGDSARATELFADAVSKAAMRGESPSRHACAALVDALDSPHLEPVQRLRTHAPLSEAVARCLESEAKLAPDEPEAARRFARWLAGPQVRPLLGEATPTRDDEREIGRVLSAAVHRTPARARGLFHELWACREPAAQREGGHLPLENVLGNVADDMSRDVRSVFLAVKRWLLRRRPDLAPELDSYRYVLKVTKDDEPSSGRSAGLAAGLAFLSVFLRRPLVRPLAVTGALVTDSHRVLVIGRVGDIEPKVLAAYESHIDTLLLPTANQSDLERSLMVPRAVTDEVVKFVATFDEAVHLAFGESALTRR
jgi:hypothetical protein